MSRKQKLTTEQIEYILDFIVPNKWIPKDIANELCEKHKNLFRSQLERVKVYPEVIDTLKENIKQMYLSSLVRPGESVGVITAQSIGERQTQSNLNTFHKAGSSDKQPTVSKFSELLNATPNPKSPSYFIHFLGGNDSVPDLRNLITFNIVEMSLSKIITGRDFVVGKEKDPWYIFYETLYSPLDKVYKDCIVFRINMDMLFEYKLTLREISQRLNLLYDDCTSVFSPDNIGEIHFYANTENIELPEGEEVVYINKDNMKEIYLEENVYPSIVNKTLFGIQGIQNIFFLRDMETKKWFIETENKPEKSKKNKKDNGKKSKGKNTVLNSQERFKSLLSKDFVDSTKTISNNIWDIYNCFGIEATRQYMIEEFGNIMKGINVCHVSLLTDKMTFEGTISSVSRYTMRTDECGPLTKATFEEILDNLLKAGVYGQEETTQGVSASIICGKQAKIGTGYCSVSLDLDKIEEGI